MRNLLLHPVTDEERVEVLTDVLVRIMDEACCGDMRPLILQDAIDRFRVPTDMERLDRDCRIIRLNELLIYLRANRFEHMEFGTWADDIAAVLLAGKVDTPVSDKEEEG